MKKKGFKRVLGLKKWNRIVSSIVKANRKAKIDYDIKDVRKQASEVYKSFKSVPLSKLSQKRINKVKTTLGKPQKSLKTNTIRILATDVPKDIVDKLTKLSFFQLGDGGGDKFDLTDFNRMFPDVPILIKTPNNEFKINGLMGGYGSSDLANFVNSQLREEYGSKEDYNKLFESSVAIQEKNKLPYILITPEDLSDKDLNKLLKTKVVFPKKVDIVTKKAIDKVIETEKERKKRLKKEKEAEKKRKKGTIPTTKPKTTTPTKLKKVSTKKTERTTDEKERLGKLRIEEQKNIIEMVKLGVLSKKEAKTMIMELDNKYGKGGKI